MAYWLTRDEWNDARGTIWDGKPKRSNGKEFQHSKTAFPEGSLGVDFLEEVSGVFLKPGEIRKVKSINITLEK